VVIEAVLLAVFGSAVFKVTDAVLVIVVLPLTITVTTICADSCPLFKMSPTYHVTVPVCPIGGPVKTPLFALAETNVEPLESTSFTTAFIAVSGPKLRTVMV
jgi:hypothetical protein